MKNLLSVFFVLSLSSCFESDLEVDPSKVDTDLASQSNTCLDPSNVANGLTYICPDGTSLVGSYTPETCSSDGETDCYIDSSSSSFKAVDSTQIDPWEIRRSILPDGSVKTIAGVEGKIKFCKNNANLNITGGAHMTTPFDNTAAPAVVGLDIYDNIDDYNGGISQKPQDALSWSIPGVSGTYGAEQFSCGGIYSTGNVTTGNTGADPALAHNPIGNWQDLTPGIVPGGASSTNPQPGCNATDKSCVFRELNSGLLVTEISAGSMLWQPAIDYCEALGEPDPIPTVDVGIGTAHDNWRIPTQKEALYLILAGFTSLTETATLQGNFGSASETIWTSTTHSPTVNHHRAWSVNTRYAEIYSHVKASNNNKVLCIK